MYSKYSVLSLVLLASANAKPAPLSVLKRGSSAVPPVTNPGASPFANADSAVLPVTKSGASWVANFGFGSPQKEVGILLDTGSGGLWVSDGSAYQPTASSTFKNHTVTPEAWSIGYLGASVSGYRANDTVHLGVVEVPNTIVEVATNVGAGLPAGGIVELNLPGPGYKTAKDSSNYFLEDLLQPYLPDLVFTTNFKESGGSVGFGSVDASQYKPGTMSAPIPVNAANVGWRLDDIYFTVGGKPVPNLSVGSGLGFDTGTGNTALPNPVTDAFYNGITGVQQQGSGYSVPCDAHLPEIGFHHGSATAQPFVTISAGNITLNPDCGDGACDGRCTSQVQRVVQTYTNGGNPFLQSAFIVWRPDIANPSMAFAAQA